MNARRPALLLLLTAALATPTLAGDLNVAPGGSIQAAIAAAAPGDRVLVAPGTYTETLDLLGKAIEVIGLGGPTATILDGGGAAPVVRFATGEGSATRLVGFAVTGGHASFGTGGILCATGTTPTITDCIVRGNTGRIGAGVSGAPRMERCVITGNVSSLNHGGGIYGAPTLLHCVVAGNTCTSADGGGLYVKGGAALVEDSLILDNRAVFANSHGGGIYVDSSGSLVLRRSVVRGNSASGGAFAGYGGGLLAEAAGSLVERCTVVDNVVSGSSTQGAGIWGPFTVTNSIVRDNLGGDVQGATVTWSSVSGGYAGVGNVDLPADFVAPGDGDLHLDHGSAVVDLGDPADLDPDGTRADLGAFPFATLYARANADPATWTAPSWSSLDAVVGGSLRLRVLAGQAHAGEAYWVLGSTSGTAPGLDLLGAHLPLNYDAYMQMTLTQPNGPALSGFLGLLDAQGRADAGLVLPGEASGSLAGITGQHAALVGVPGVTVVPLVTSVEVLEIL